MARIVLLAALALLVACAADTVPVRVPLSDWDSFHAQSQARSDAYRRWLREQQ